MERLKWANQVCPSQIISCVLIFIGQVNLVFVGIILSFLLMQEMSVGIIITAEWSKASEKREGPFQYSFQDKKWQDVSLVHLDSKSVQFLIVPLSQGNSIQVRNERWDRDWIWTIQWVPSHPVPLAIFNVEKGMENVFPTISFVTMRKIVRMEKMKEIVVRKRDIV